MGERCWLEMESFPARQRFHVESERGSVEVSWSKLQKLLPTNAVATSANLLATTRPGLDSRIAPEMISSEAYDGRMNAVIEKIERLYQGHSEDDEGGDEDDRTTCVPAEEDYDTEDTFIDDEDLDEYFEVNRTKTKHTGFYVNKGSLEKRAVEGKSLDEASGLKVYKKRKRPAQERPPASKKAKSDDEDAVKAPQANNKKTSFTKTIKACATKGPLAERNNGLCIDPSNTTIASDEIKTPPKESSPGRKTGPKLTMLDRAIQELEKEVADRCPPSTEKNHETEYKKRIPKEVKARLAKVARLAQKQSKIGPEELLNVLMKIMGHLMQIRSLKRNLKEMAELGISAQKEKQSKLETMKKEIVDMLKSRITPQQSAQDNSQCEEATCDGRYRWDAPTEDRISDFYELYVEGIDEHKSAATKKFYAELAELWPEGWMDSNGIKNAVLRAKERKKGAMKQAKLEERKRKKATVATPKSVKKPESPPKTLELQEHYQEQRREEHEEAREEVVVEGVRSSMSIAVMNPASSTTPWRDCPSGNGGVVMPSSLRQIKRKLLDKASNRSFCDSITPPPSSLMWMVKDPKPG
ncbi:hypothetical protein SELMODRAFT_402672 [Selaginella moellendorffii]|uniref:Hpc2-related domain-containing protein n=1 Tax=Selaginella moellendorffii TaxID=88036 RepID=D8QMN7_SELML|nr:hypothetical protein SELMODRAFT_402672 [Selaginella moellendorffii]